MHANIILGKHSDLCGWDDGDGSGARSAGFNRCGGSTGLRPGGHDGLRRDWASGHGWRSRDHDGRFRNRRIRLLDFLLRALGAVQNRILICAGLPSTAYWISE